MSTGAPPPPPPLSQEPFRAFFPLGVALGWVGVGPWLLYAGGIAETYSCLAHGLVQTQSFLVAFAIGFLWTALPRRTGTPGPTNAETGLAAALLASVATALSARAWTIAECCELAVLLLLARFAVARLAGRNARRRPPAAFVLIPIGLAAGIAGAFLLLAGLSGFAGPRATRVGALLAEQGVFLCLVMGAGALVLPLVAGGEPPADLGTGPGDATRLFAWTTAGVGLLATLPLEVAGFERAAPLLRAAILAVTLTVGVGAAGPLRKPGFHRRLVRLAAWLMPVGLAVSALLPDYRVAALHVLFIGGFGLLAFAVATHVVLGHLDLVELANGRPRAIVVLAAALALALLARLAADSSRTYFEHLASASACWVVGTAAWLRFVGPCLLARERASRNARPDSHDAPTSVT